MDITRSSLLSTLLYSALLIVLFWSGEAAQVSEVGGFVPRHYIGALLVFVLSMMTARIAIKRVIYLERTYMPSVLYVLVCSSFRINVLSITPLLCAMLIAQAVSLLIKSHRFSHIASKQIVSAATYFGVAVLIYPAMVYIAPLLFIGLVMFRRFMVREWIVAIVGLVFPLFMYFLWIWVSGGDVVEVWSSFVDTLTYSDGSVDALMLGGKISGWQYCFLFVCLLLLVLTFVRFFRQRQLYKKHSRRSFAFFSFFVVWSIAVMLFSPVRQLSMLPIVAIPFAIVIPTYFAFSRPTFFMNFIYLMLLLSAVAIHVL